MSVNEYITQNWEHTIRIPGEADDKSFFRMPTPYSVPCAKTLFTGFFYWDTYFANLGLLIDGRAEQAKNNLTVMKFFIDRLGFVPNADHILTRSQPPLFTRGVYDYFMKTGDKAFVRDCLDSVKKEFEFFETDRMTPCGLNAYGHNETKAGRRWYYDEFGRRLGFTREEKSLDKDEFVSGLLAIAESGWDFNPRFYSDGNRFAACEFAHLDLNCILFDAENKAAALFSALGNVKESAKYAAKAERRKELINKLLLEPESGVYYDYNYVRGKFSTVASCASLYPYAFGVSGSAEGAKAVLGQLELPHGLSVCPYRGDNAVYWQWDYPSMWPSNVYFAYEALVATRLDDDAARIAGKYIGTVDRVFAQTGELWEKYDALEGKVSVTCEYDTPEMLGWTAGVYKYLAEKTKRNG